MKRIILEGINQVNKGLGKFEILKSITSSGRLHSAMMTSSGK